jgi:hypothetical protein
LIRKTGEINNRIAPPILRSAFLQRLYSVLNPHRLAKTQRKSPIRRGVPKFGERPICAPYEVPGIIADKQ